MKGIRLGVNIDHVATVRNARGETYPSPLRAALLAQKSGADSVTIHLREDRRHINEFDLKKIIKKNKLDARIHQPVPHNRVPEIYANSDIIVFPSIWPEPFGRITIEAGAARKPVVGSKVGAIAETITDTNFSEEI